MWTPQRVRTVHVRRGPSESGLQRTPRGVCKRVRFYGRRRWDCLFGHITVADMRDRSARGTCTVVGSWFGPTFLIFYFLNFRSNSTSLRIDRRMRDSRTRECFLDVCPIIFYFLFFIF
jgi:hypothetical protein